jgi:tRNA(Ile)-lysidine synthase
VNKNNKGANPQNTKAQRPDGSEKPKPKKNKKDFAVKKGPWQNISNAQLTPGQKCDPFFKNFFTKLTSSLQKDLMIPHSSKILCAVSGGVDSIVMLDALAVLAARYDYRIAVVHVNHNLRGESSDRDERHVKSVCQQHGFYIYSSKVNVKEYAEKHSLTIEEAARKLRYGFYDRIASSINAPYVAMAHTADDNAETVLFNLIRGTGLTGLSGIPEKRMLNKKTFIIRPLLNFHKKELIDYAEKRELVWHEDETNALLYYTRNKIRHELIPTLERDFSPAVIDTINRSSRLIAGADEFISSHIRDVFSMHFRGKKGEKLSFEVSFMKSNDKFIQGELLQEGIRMFFGLKSIPLSTIDRIFDLMDSDTGTVIELGNKLIALKNRSIIFITKQTQPIEINMKIENLGEYEFAGKKLILEQVDRRSLSFSEDSSIELLDMEFLPKFLYVRNWEEGDRFNPLGMDGSMKISDFLTNEKVNLIDKKKVYVLATKTEIIWVIGMRISDKYKVTKSTKKILRAKIEDAR